MPSSARCGDFTTGCIVCRQAKLPVSPRAGPMGRRRAPPRLPALRATGSFRRLRSPAPQGANLRTSAPSAAVQTAHRPTMAVLQLDDQQFPLTGDTTRIGSGADADVALPGVAASGVQAVIVRTGAHALHIRRAAPQSQVRVNGVLLGPEPTPLMHGDKVEVSGLELRFADESKRGATQYMSLEAIPPAEGMARRTGA